jgi:hypothetical protein
MERLAKRITLANQLDSAMPNQPTTSDEDTPKPRSKR